MTPKQLDAINDLELGFAKAKRAGLVFYVRDSQMDAYDAQTVREHIAAGMDYSDATQAADDTASSVETHGTLLDSGQ